jgi:hypothetical protein
MITAYGVILLSPNSKLTWLCVPPIVICKLLGMNIAMVTDTRGRCSSRALVVCVKSLICRSRAMRTWSKVIPDQVSPYWLPG